MRIVLIGVAPAIAGALSAAGSATEAAPRALTSARLFVSGASQAVGGPGGIRIRYEQQQQSDDPAARVTIYVPRGYQVQTGHAPATRLGTAAARILAADLHAAVPAAGTVDVAGAADFAEQATACTGTATHEGIWALRLTVAGTPLVVPAFVDTITSGPLMAFATAQIVICLQAGDLPPAAPGRAPLGAKVLTVDFTSSAFVNPAAAGEYRWRATVLPYTPYTGEVNVAGTVEVQALVALPARLALTVKPKQTPKAETHTIGYRGTVRAYGRGVADARIDVLRGRTALSAKKFKTQTTDENGTFGGSFALRKGRRPAAVFLVAKASVPEQDLGAAECVPSFSPPDSPPTIPCQDATAGGFDLISRSVTLRIPAAPKQKR